VVGSWILKAQRGLTSVGEVLGWDWLIDNPLVYFGFARATRRNAPVLVQAIKDCLPQVHRIVDVGCGTGAFLAWFRKAGVDAIGVEFAARLRARCARKGLTVYPFDVSQNTPSPPGIPFDLALSTEVAEHIPPEFADAMVAYICQLSDLVVFTAAHPGQGGTGHVNEQPRQYWIDKFTGRAMDLDEQGTAAIAAKLQASPAFPYLRENLSVFRRRAT